MTPGISDGLAITFYFLFWGAVFAMAEQGLIAAGYYLYFSWTPALLLAALFSYMTVWLDKVSA